MVKTNTIDNIKFGDHNITDNNQIANTFNSFFAEIGSKLASDISPTYTDPIKFIQPYGSEFTFRAITTVNLIQTIRKISLNKAPV